MTRRLQAYQTAEAALPKLGPKRLQAYQTAEAALPKLGAKRFAMLSLLVLVAGGLLFAAPAAADSPKQIEIEVSEHGWNNDPNAIFTVEEGEAVEFIFTYGDGHLPEDNPHVMMIEGTEVESGKISKENPRDVMRFVPEQTGTYTLQCKLSCTGHGNLTGGRIRVVAAGGGATQPTETAVSLVTVPPQAAGESAEVRAKVTTAAGEPLEGATVQFSVRTTFTITDWMAVGTARTGADGQAVLRYRPNRGGDQTVRAYYPGSGRYVGSESLMSLAVPDMQPAVQHAQESLRIPGLGFWLLWLILGSIWSIYMLIFFNLRQVALNR